MNNRELNPRKVYADIIDLPHYQSQTHPHMSVENRAAQFMPFQAVVGYEDMVQEEARLTDDQIILSDTEKAALNERFNVINDHIRQGLRPLVTVTYFVPDDLKDGGRYETIEGQARRLDPVSETIMIDNDAGRTEIRMDMILRVEGIIFKE